MDADALVIERLLILAEYVSDLKAFQQKATSFRVYENDLMLRRAVERTLQLCAEVCLDIGRRLIALEGFRYATDNKDIFRVLAEEKIVPHDLLPTLQDMAGFRNLVVHEYTKIDNASVYGILKNRLGDFDDYARAIGAYIAGE